MGKGVILIGCIVYFGFAFVQPFELTAHLKRNYHDGIRENFQNLFDSVVESDAKKTEIYRDILNHEAKKEQHAFHAMKNELRTAQNRNSFKKTYFHKKSHMAVKRETNENKTTSPSPTTPENQSSTQTPQNNTNVSVQGKPSAELEKKDEFHKYKPPKVIYDWKHVEAAYDRKDIKFLRYLCTTVHELVGWGRVKVINNFFLDTAKLLFKDPQYHPVDIRVLQYVIHPPQIVNNSEPTDHFYVTEGLEEDCIMYLKPTDRRLLTSFNIDEPHVCGVHRAVQRIPNTTSTCAAAAQGYKQPCRL